MHPAQPFVLPNLITKSFVMLTLRNPIGSESPIPVSLAILNPMGLDSVDFVPPMYSAPTGIAKMVVLEDNDATIKMVIKGRSPAMRHVQRTHRIDLDWLFESFRIDPGL